MFNSNHLQTPRYRIYTRFTTFLPQVGNNLPYFAKEKYCDIDKIFSMDNKSESSGYLTESSSLGADTEGQMGSSLGHIGDQNMALNGLSPEQYDLLQQLKESNMSIEDVHFALDELDRLEVQFNVSIVENYY